MLHASLVTAVIRGREASYTPCAITVTETPERGDLCLSLDVPASASLISHEHTAEPPATVQIILPRERTISLTADMLRHRWYIHVHMASGRVDITVTSRRQQSTWFAVIHHQQQQQQQPQQPVQEDQEGKSHPSSPRLCSFFTRLHCSYLVQPMKAHPGQWTTTKRKK